MAQAEFQQVFINMLIDCLRGNPPVRKGICYTILSKISKKLNSKFLRNSKPAQPQKMFLTLEIRIV